MPRQPPADAVDLANRQTFIRDPLGDDGCILPIRLETGDILRQQGYVRPFGLGARGLTI